MFYKRRKGKTPLNVYFVSMLPGLGKSTISDNSHQLNTYNMFDFGDLINQKKAFYRNNLKFDNRGLSFKDITQTTDLKQRALDTVQVINLIIDFVTNVDDDLNTIYIFSSVWWEHMGIFNTDIFVGMEPQLYNGKYLSSEGRMDLANKYSDETLAKWANGFLNPNVEHTVKKNTFVTLALVKAGYLTPNVLERLIIDLFKEKDPIIWKYDQESNTISVEDKSNANFLNEKDDEIMGNSLVKENSFESGIVTHVTGHKQTDVKNQDSDYGLRIIVTLSDNSFFVVKYKVDYVRDIKSVKFWVNIDIDTYAKHNTKIEPVEEGWENLNLPAFLEKLMKDPTYGPRFLDEEYDDILVVSRNYFGIIEEDINKMAFHSFYVNDTGKSSDGTEARRLAFISDAFYDDDVNVVVKLWKGLPYNEAKMSIKFDDTPIAKMAKEWNMNKETLDDHGLQFILSLGDKVAPIGSKEAVNINNTNYDSSNKLKREDMLFNFPDVNLEFYIIEERAVIVFQMTLSDTYVLWDVMGREDHRVIISAKGPFDSSLNVTEDEVWDVCSYDQTSFLAAISISREEIVKTFSKYSFKWMLNAQDLSVTSNFKKRLK